MTSCKTCLDAVNDIADTIRRHADEAERSGRLHDAVVGALHEAGLFRMQLSESDGGAALRMADAFRVIEATAYIDGATGWNLAIGANALLLAMSNIEDAEVRAEVLADPRALIAGGIAPLGITSTPAPGGVRLNGTLPFASGSAHATWLAALTVNNGRLAMTLFRPSEAMPLDTWDVSGLRATGSNDWVVNDVFVPAGRVFPVRTLGSVDRDAMAALPPMSLLGAGITFVAIGIAAHALDVFGAIAATAVPFGGSSTLNQRPDVQVAAAGARGFVEAARATMTQRWSALESLLLAGREPSVAALSDLRLASVTAVRLAVDAVDELQRAAGSRSLFVSAGLERCWRDIHAVTQHAAVSPRHLIRIGALSLGLDPGPGPI